MHPTLLVGPYDWDAQRIPKEEFSARIQAFREQISAAECSVTIVYGDSRNHAELMYLSNFVPKLGPALLLIPRDGEPTLLVSGAPNMLPAARRLTWIENTQPLGDPGKVIAHWMTGSGASGHHRVALVGGEYMRTALHRSLSEAFGLKNTFLDATPVLKNLMRHKRPRELKLIREACSILRAATNTLAEANSAGASVTGAILEAERAAHHAGAQDVRTLFSVDGGGTLRPFEAPIAHAVDPLQAYIAVRHAGYWAEGFVALPSSRQPVLAKAAEVLKTVIKIATAGTKCRDLASLTAEALSPYHEHAMTTGNIGNSIGLSLAEEPRLLAGSEDSLEADCVYTLRAGASGGQKDHAVVSAMVAVHRDGNEVLWSVA